MGLGLPDLLGMVTSLKSCIVTWLECCIETPSGESECAARSPYVTRSFATM